MKLFSYEVPLDFNLFLFGDTHEGTVLQHREGIKELKEVILHDYEGVKSRNNYSVFHGDVLEGITIDDPRYNIETVQGTVLKQIENAAATMRPIRKTMLALLDGNHPKKLWRFGDITQEVCKKINVPFGTWTSKITFTHRKKSLFKSYHTHGFRSIGSAADDVGRRILNWNLALKRHLREKAADCILMCKGHTHKLLVHQPTEALYLCDDGKQLKQRYTNGNTYHGDTEYIPPDYRWYVNTGSFLRMYGDPAAGISSYSEVAEYDPLELGCAVALVRGGIIQDVRKLFF